MNMTLHVLPYILALLTSVSVAIFAFSHRQKRGALPFATVASLQSLWTLGFIFEISASTLEGKIFWDWLQYLPSIFWPLAFVNFCVRYADMKIRRPLFFWTALGGVILAYMIYVALEPWHHKIYANAQIVQQGGAADLHYPFSLSAIFIFGWAAFVLLIGLGILIRRYIEAAAIYRQQVLTLIVGTFVPFLGQTLTMADVTIGSHRDMSPISFAISNLIVGYALFRMKLLDVVPVARDRLLDLMHDFCIVVDRKRRILDINRACRTLFSVTEKAEGQSCDAIFSKWPQLLTVIQMQMSNTGTVMALSHGDSTFSVSCDVYMEKKRIAAWLIVGHDITERIRSEKMLQQLNENLEERVSRRTAELASANHEIRTLQLVLQQIVDKLPFGLIGVDGSGAVSHWNDWAEKVTDIPKSDALGRPVEAVWQKFPNDLRRIQKAMDGHPVLNEREQCAELDKVHHLLPKTYEINTYTVDSGVILVRKDITEQMQFLDTIIQSEKMVAVGGLATGMAHELNNPLAGIFQSLQVIGQRLDPLMRANIKVAETMQLPMDAIVAYVKQRKIDVLLAQAQSSTRQAADIVAGMLFFARPKSTEYAPLDIPALVNDTLKIARTDFSPGALDFKKIDVIIDATHELPSPKGIAQQIQQVLLNLLKNAADAVKNNPLDRPPKIQIRLFHESRWLVIEMEDNGQGMNPDWTSRVFEPFFTTKSVREGTGLGLSVSYFIITENHNGKMEVKSEENRGSCFRVRLPLEGS
ncbi:MAG: PAS domain-containing protein [Deltaproteobacteria bacterium]|nr:PAS domain-containing protein [Deltaproteobacteria bacterium]